MVKTSLLLALGFYVISMQDFGPLARGLVSDPTADFEIKDWAKTKEVNRSLIKFIFQYAKLHMAG